MTTRPALLVVDDDPNYREMIVTIGQMRGIVVLEAGDCGQALRILDSEKNRVKLILLDYFMPGMEPKQCGAAIIAKAGPSIPIILVTAAVDPAVRAAELNLDQWLSKPFDMSELEALFRKVA
jgi:two-component system response regulator ArlR